MVGVKVPTCVTSRTRALQDSRHCGRVLPRLCRSGEKELLPTRLSTVDEPLNVDEPLSVDDSGGGLH